MEDCLRSHHGGSGTPFFEGLARERVSMSFGGPWYLVQAELPTASRCAEAELILHREAGRNSG